MIIKEDFKMQLKDIGKDNYIKNRAILEIFELIIQIWQVMVQMILKGQVYLGCY